MTPVASTGLPPSLIRHRPVTSKFSSARPSGSITRWHDAHAGFFRCSSIRSRTDSSLPSDGRTGLLERRHVRRRRRRRRPEQHFHDPLAAHHRRRAIGDRREQQHAAVAEQPAPVLGHFDAAERGAGDVRDAVVLRDPLVDVGVVRRQQVEHAAVLADDALEEQLRLANQRIAERAIEVRIQDRVGQDLVDVVQPQPLRREPCRERFRPRIRQQPLRLFVQHAGRAQPSLRGDRHQLGVRRRAPEEEGQSRREIEIGDADRLAGRCAAVRPPRRGRGTAGSPASLRWPPRPRARSRAPSVPRRRSASAAGGPARRPAGGTPASPGS